MMTSSIPSVTTIAAALPDGSRFDCSESPAADIMTTRGPPTSDQRPARCRRAQMASTRDARAAARTSAWGEALKADHPRCSGQGPNSRMLPSPRQCPLVGRRHSLVGARNNEWRLRAASETSTDNLGTGRPRGRRKAARSRHAKAAHGRIRPYWRAAGCSSALASTSRRLQRANEAAHGRIRPVLARRGRSTALV